jgi:hypothetical protein
MITFHLGVIDIPYEDENTTTGDVAEYLEEKYQIMQTFFDRYSNDIADLMANDMAASLENMMAGAPPAKTLWQSRCPGSMTCLSPSSTTPK